MVASTKRVLVVDDEPIVCESYRRVLTDAGYAVRTAQCGREALAACRTDRFDVLLADLKMPDMDGLEVTRTVRHEFPDVQVVIITAYPTEQTADAARGLGVFDYLEKPLSPDRLSAATAAAASAPAARLAPAVPPEAAPAPTAAVAQAAAVSPAAVRPVEAPAVPPTSVVAPPAWKGVLKTVGMLALGPLIGLAYVMFLPIIGFGMLIAVIGLAVAKQFGWARS